MDKEKIIKKIHKILFIYENFGYMSYNSYLSKTIIMLNGVDNQDVLNDAIVMLNGLKKMEENISHTEIRSVIIEIMNEIDRKYLEV